MFSICNISHKSLLWPKDLSCYQTLIIAKFNNPHVYICLVLFSSFSQRISANTVIEATSSFLINKRACVIKFLLYATYSTLLRSSLTFAFNHEGVFPIQVPSPMWFGAASTEDLKETNDSLSHFRLHLCYSKESFTIKTLTLTTIQNNLS